MSKESICIDAPTTIEQTAFDRLKDLIRAGAIDYLRLTDPNWRNNPWKDGVVVDLDEDEALDHIARYVASRASKEGSAAHG